MEASITLEAPIRSVVLCGDPGCDGYNPQAILVLESILRLPSDFHILLGDLVPKGRDPFFEAFKKLVNTSASPPVYCLPGNHDLPAYSEFLGMGDYFIHAPNALFILLDNARRYFREGSIHFLRKTLDEQPGENVFLLFHIPPPNPFIPNHVSEEEWGKVKAALGGHRNRIRMIFSGHVHSAFDYVLDGIRVIVTGGGGAGLDPVENTCLRKNAYHAFRLEYHHDEWVALIHPLHPEATASGVYETSPESQIVSDLKESFAGESQAYRRYRLYAEAAEADQLPGVAKLFRAAAESEYIHAANFYLASQEGSSTKANLEKAIAREHEEIDSLYPLALEHSQDALSQSPGNAFHCALAAERVHHNLLQAALRRVECGEDLEEQDYFTCLRCGYTHAGSAPPTLCPACGTDRFKFQEVQ